MREERRREPITLQGGVRQRDRDQSPDEAKPRARPQRSTVSFYKEKLGNLLDYAPFAKAKLDSIDEAMIDEYKNKRSRQVSRRKIPLAPGVR